MSISVQLPADLDVQDVDRFAMGGMAEVFRATKVIPDEGRVGVVVKHMHAQFNGDKDLVRRFRDEARLGLRLNHENIVRVFEYKEIDGHHYMVMEEIDGPDLHRVIRRARRLVGMVPEPVAAYFFLSIARALSYMADARTADGRSLNLVHRDISPANILVSRFGATKLIDFGVARAENRESLTVAGHVYGKYSYMSPEQVRRTEVDIRTDLFALGAVAYEVLTGRKAFRGVSELEIAAEVIEREPPPIAEVRGACHPRLVEAVRRCLAKDVDERYPHPAELVDALMGYFEEMGVCPGPRLAADFLAELDDLETDDGGAVSADDLEDTGERQVPSWSSGLVREPQTIKTPLPEDVVISGENTVRTPTPLAEGTTARGQRTAPVVSADAGEGDGGLDDLPPRASARRGSPRKALLAVGAGVIIALVIGTAIIAWPEGSAAPPASGGPTGGGAADAGMGGAPAASAVPDDGSGEEPRGGAAAGGDRVEVVGVASEIAVEDGSPPPPDLYDPDEVRLALADAHEDEERAAVVATASPERGGDEEGTPGEVVATGTVSFRSSRPVQVWIDGHFQGNTPLLDLELRTGEHEVEYHEPSSGWTRKGKLHVGVGANRDVHLDPGG